MAFYDVKLIEKKQVAEGTMEFVLTKPEGFTYKAGQFFDIILDKSSPDAEKGTYQHGFSLLSAPFEDHLAAATRMRSGSAFKNAIAKVPEGADLEIEALWGDFTLRKDTSRPVVFIIGGIGITPVRSMVAQATHDKTDHEITLIYANRTPAQAAFIDELKGYEKENPNFHMVQVYTQADVDEAGVEHGHVDADMIKRHVADVEAPIYYMSGPRGMVYAMRDILVDIGADEDWIKTEEFEGY